MIIAAFVELFAATVNTPPTLGRQNTTFCSPVTGTFRFVLLIALFNILSRTPGVQGKWTEGVWKK